jgi:predicted Zn-dependent protease with MMP-like domain
MRQTIRLVLRENLIDLQDMQGVVVHEFGHHLGLGHAGEATEMVNMVPVMSSGKR